MKLTEAAPAKLNLALHVRRRRADGYHDLETIFAFTKFGDTLTAESAADLTLTATGEFAAAIGTADNLVLRAARALAAAAGIEAGAALHLDKRIPVAAGLGGGSADAAAALRLLNRLWRIDWPLARLAALGAMLGADVAACVHSRATLGSGRGEVLEAYDAPIAGMPVLLVNPRVAVTTGPVFAGWDGIDAGALDPALPLSALRNDLEPPASRIAPLITRVLTSLSALGADLVRMSGSGATCLALYATVPERDSACTAIASAHPEWWTRPTLLR